MAEQIPVIRMALTYPLGGRDGATLAFETYLAQDASTPEIDALADKMESVAARQMLKGILASKKDRLETTETQLSHMAADYVRVQALYEARQDAHHKTRKGPLPFTAKERMDKELVESNIKLTKDTVARLRVDIAELEQVLSPAPQVQTPQE